MVEKYTLKHLSLLVFLPVLFINCNSKKAPSQWDKERVEVNSPKNDNYSPEKTIPKWNEAEIKDSISKASVYARLDSQNEIFSVFEKQDTLMKRTSDVAYFFTGEKIDLKDSGYSKLNNCKAYYFHSDTLLINIGIGNGLTDRGFVIRYKNRNFYTEPYFSTDIVMEHQKEPIYKILYQKLILDKAHYKIGDSLYGRIEFKSIETTTDNRKQEHFGIGNFRAKVRKF